MDKYFNIISSEDSDSAEILLYGYIGDHWDEEKKNSDVSFVKELNRLAKKHSRINIRINSMGGSIYHGNAIVNAIISCKSEVHTYLDGLAASMGFMIWASAKHRHSAVNALAMSHCPLSGAFGNAADLRREADILDKFEETLVGTLVHSLGMEEKEVKDTFFSMDDKWMSRKELKSMGLITEDDSYTAENDLPENVENMSYSDIINHFKGQKDPGRVTLREGIRSKISKAQNSISKRAAALLHHKPDKEMNIEEFKNSITNGDLIIEDVKAHLASLETPAAEATPAPSSPVATLEEGPDLAKLVQDAVNAALVPQQEALRVANEKIAELEKLPGASRSNPPIPTEKLPEGVTDGAAYAEYLEGVKQFENTNETFSY